MDPLMIAASIATIIGGAAATIQICIWLGQWWQSRIDGQRSKKGGQECVMLDSPLTKHTGQIERSSGVEVKISVFIEINELDHAKVAHLKTMLVEGLFNCLPVDSIEPNAAIVTMEPKDDEKP